MKKQYEALKIEILSLTTNGDVLQASLGDYDKFSYDFNWEDAWS